MLRDEQKLSFPLFSDISKSANSFQCELIPIFWFVCDADDLLELWIIVSTFSNAYCKRVANSALQPERKISLHWLHILSWFSMSRNDILLLFFATIDLISIYGILGELDSLPCFSINSNENVLWLLWSSIYVTAPMSGQRIIFVWSLKKLI